LGNRGVCKKGQPAAEKQHKKKRCHPRKGTQGRKHIGKKRPTGLPQKGKNEPTGTRATTRGRDPAVKAKDFCGGGNTEKI